MHNSLPFVPILLTVLSPFLTVSAAKPRNAILLSNVESLTLRGDRQTSHRRVEAIPQLQCISSRALCAKYEIDLMRCENKGSGYDTEDIQWSCTAQLPPELKLGSTDVICEGYDSADDPYVLKGSCGVQYRLALTRQGEERWPDLAGGSDDDGHPSFSGPNNSFAARWFPSLFWLIFFSVLGFIVYSAWKERNLQQSGNGGDPNRRAPRRGDGGWGGGGGGGGGDDDGWDDPPPPYPGTQHGWRQAPRKQSSSSSAPRSTRNSSGGSNWQSNILSGAAGAAAGYYAGNRGWGNSRNNNDTTSRNYGSMRGSGGWDSSPGGSSSGSSASTSRYESTGFGSTSRR